MRLCVFQYVVSYFSILVPGEWYELYINQSKPRSFCLAMVNILGQSLVKKKPASGVQQYPKTKRFTTRGCWTAARKVFNPQASNLMENNKNIQIIWKPSRQWFISSSGSRFIFQTYFLGFHDPLEMTSLPPPPGCAKSCQEALASSESSPLEVRRVPVPARYSRASASGTPKRTGGLGWESA